MKNHILYFLFLFVMGSLFANKACAGEPIPGVGVGAGKNPGGQLISKTVTDKAGMFSMQPVAGDYTLTVSYTDATRIIGAIRKNAMAAGNVVISLALVLPKDALVNGKPYTGPIAITDKFKGVNITAKAGSVIKGTCSYTISTAKPMLSSGAAKTSAIR